MSGEGTTDCASCGVKSLCFGIDLSHDQLPQMGHLPFDKRRVLTGQPLYKQDDKFSNVYAIISGSSKAVVCTPGGSRITHLALRGDLVGFSGIACGTMPETQIALENCVFCVIPYHRLMRHIQHAPMVGQQFHRAIARTMLQQRAVQLLVDYSNAERKISGFLVWFSQQLAERGQYFTDFTLPLSRSDLANFLGIRLETVSRAFSRLIKLRAIKAHGRYVCILDSPSLEAWAVSSF